MLVSRDSSASVISDLPPVPGDIVIVIAAAWVTESTLHKVLAGIQGLSPQRSITYHSGGAGETSVA